MSWKRSFDDGVEIQSKLRNCEDCRKNESETCKNCDIKVYQHEEIKVE